MPFEIVRSDITTMHTDAIVNAANTALQQGGGVCGAIFKAAGESELQRACNAIGRIQTGQAVITPGFGLKAKYIVHTAGPVWRGGGEGEEEQLKSCYRNSLLLAKENGCNSIAFPLISSGIYGYPKEQALRVAADTIREFLDAQSPDDENDMTVYLCVFDKAAFSLSEALFQSVRSYIDDEYAQAHSSLARRLLQVETEALSAERQEELESASAFGKRFAMPAPAAAFAPTQAPKAKGLDDLIGRLDESFSTSLLRLIDIKGRTDAQVYKRANIDRRLFSKIRCDSSYMPSKRTALALCVALELSVEETKDLLSRAGYTLSKSQKLDVIVEYFLREEMYDIFAINEALFYFDQPLLGG